MHGIGARLKLWRGQEKLTQPEAATCLGVPFRTYQNYEGGVRPPNTDAWLAFARAGINANWLLTGEGPMLLADLAPPEPEPVRINRGALAALLRGAIAITAQGMSVEAAADMAAEMYERALQNGEITPEGVGQGSLGNAA